MRLLFSLLTGAALASSPPQAKKPQPIMWTSNPEYLSYATVSVETLTKDQLPISCIVEAEGFQLLRDDPALDSFMQDAVLEYPDYPTARSVDNRLHGSIEDGVHKAAASALPRYTAAELMRLPGNELPFTSEELASFRAELAPLFLAWEARTVRINVCRIQFGAYE